MDSPRAGFDLFPRPDLHLAVAVHEASERLAYSAALAGLAPLASRHPQRPWLSNRQFFPGGERSMLGCHSSVAVACAHWNSQRTALDDSRSVGGSRFSFAIHTLGNLSTVWIARLFS